MPHSVSTSMQASRADDPSKHGNLSKHMVASGDAPTNTTKLAPLQPNNEMIHDGPRSGSFSSVEEDVEGVSQSFLVRVRSSRDLLTRGIQAEDWARCLPAHGISLHDEAIEEDSSGDSATTTPDIESPWASDFFNKPVKHAAPTLGALPLEVLENIFEFLVLDLPPQDYGPRNVDIVSCLRTSKSLYKAAMNVLYKNITIPHSYVFSKFLSHISRYPELGRFVRRIDLSHFTSIGLGRTKEMNKSIKNMTSETLLQCLHLAPGIQELLLQEHLDHDLNEDVLFKTFAGLPKLRALDLCGSWSNDFEASFTSAITRVVEEDAKIRIKRLSLHECFTIKDGDIRALISRLPKLQILDLYHTRVTAESLNSIAPTARLTHLNLGLCTNITGAEVATFIRCHPAARSLVYLNLSCDPARYRLLRSSDLDGLIPALPTTLRSLNLGGAHLMAEKHMPYLRQLATHLEELGLAHTNLTIADIKSFFPPPASSPGGSPVAYPADASPTKTTLHYLDLTDVPSLTQATLFFHHSSSGARIDADHPPPIPHLLSAATLPLEVLEVGSRVATDLKRMKTSNARFRWITKELGHRNWYVREQGSREGAERFDPAGGRESGERWWKMGSRSWGSRKCSVVNAEIGGLYGFYAFKKK